MYNCELLVFTTIKNVFWLGNFVVEILCTLYTTG